MNEEQLADLLAQHLDTWLIENSLPENLPAELADLLPLAHSLTETAPVPRPEFGPALKASLLGPTGSGNSAPPAANSTWGGLALSVVVMGLIGGLVVISLLVTFIAFWGGDSTEPNGPPATALPGPTQTMPSQPTPAATTGAPTAEATTTLQTTPSQLTPTSTPVIDLLPVITITVEIKIEPPALVPGSGGGGGGSNNGGGNNGGGSGDHDKGHGNDDDHQDDDNPGKGGKD